MSWLIIPLIASFAVYHHTVIRRSGVLTANSIFVYLELIMAVGSLALIDESWESDRLYAWMIAYTFLAYLAASALLTHAYPEAPRHRAREHISIHQPTALFWLAMVLSALVVLAYFRAIGYSAFLRGLEAQVSGVQTDVATLRLDSYSGSRYLFPGYVNQLKNALLPALVVVAITHWARTGMLKRRRVPAFLWTALAVFGLLGTGQRGAFLMFAFASVVYLYMLNGNRLPRWTPVVATLTAAVLLLSTIALGRSTGDLAQGTSFEQRARVALPELTDRVLVANQGSAVIGFRYIYNYTQVQNGREWLQSAIGIFPGRAGSDLVNRIFAYRYGSLRGSSPPSIWGSVYHNFGWPGIFVAPFVLALILVLLSHLGTRGARRDSLELMGIAGVFTVFGFWVAGSPLFLLNNGVLVYALLWVVGARARRKNDSDVDAGMAVSPEPEYVRP